MKHPEDEIYEDLKGHLDEFGAEDFAAELKALADAVEAGKPIEEVEAALADVLHEIEEAREHSGASEAQEAAAILALMRNAAEEYDEGIKDGAVAELHEYQDAWGFLQTARALAEHMAGEDDAAEKAFGEKALAAIDETSAGFPSIAPEGAVDGDAGLILAAAAKVELAAYKLK